MGGGAAATGCWGIDAVSAVVSGIRATAGTWSIWPNAQPQTGQNLTSPGHIAPQDPQVTLPEPRFSVIWLFPLPGCAVQSRGCESSYFDRPADA
jgi:hypothetical protein